jgi:serine/threonine-protein kinase RsbW
MDRGWARFRSGGGKPNTLMTDSPSSSGKSAQSCNSDSNKLDLKLSVKLSADRDAVDPVVQSIMKVVREMKCADGREDDIELALTEALANAVVHGAKNDPSKIVECDVASNEQGGILIVVRDPGSGFDPSTIGNPCVGENVYSHHGRGIFLINQLMDEVQFHKNGTEIRMIKK